jgi:hypothetical protein
MIYRHVPDCDRYGGYDREKELENAELPPDRELRGEGESTDE